jgi:putative aldouronate transport system permease protein
VKDGNIVTATKRGRKKIFKRKNTIELYVMCSIPMLLLFVFNYLPMFGVIIAFKDYRFDKGIIGSDWVGLKNFEFFFKSDDFLRIVRNTLGLNTLFILLGLIASVILALLLFEIKQRRHIKIYQTVLIVPHYLSWVVVGYMAYAFLNPEYGFINSTLKIMGIGKIAWYSKPEYWPFILALASLWKGVGMGSVIYYASLMGINKEYFEAATIDGARKIDVIRYITIPFLVPLMTILTVLSIGSIFRADFGLFYQLTRDVGSLYSTTDVVDTYIYRVMKTVGDMSMASATGFLQSVVGFVLIMLTNYIVKKIEPENTLF